MKQRYFLKAWSVTDETVRQLEEAEGILETDNQSYALRRLISVGLQQLQKESA